MKHPGWLLVVAGGLIIIVGLVWLLVPTIPWLGRLPGDIVIERRNFRFYLPLTTSLLLSLLLLTIAWLVQYWLK